MNKINLVIKIFVLTAALSLSVEGKVFSATKARTFSF